MTTATHRIDCVLVKTIGPTLLLPSISIAEIVLIPNKQPDAKSSTYPDGTFLWRDQPIPIVQLNEEGANFPDNDKFRIAIVFRFPHADRLDHLVLLTNQSPQLVTVHNHNIEPDFKPKQIYPFAASYAIYEHQSVVVPELTRFTE